MLETPIVVVLVIAAIIAVLGLSLTVAKLKNLGL